MCGISCILQLRHGDKHRSGTHGQKENSQLEEDVDASLDMIRHRGPDARGIWVSKDCHVALGHVRLSINDLSPSGAQPFHSPDGKVHAVVNGEFYDYDRLRRELEEEEGYAFTSRSDSEIAIALYRAYGLDFVSHLRGEFAVVLYDEETQLFVAVRDRYGIKPLFWTVQQGRLLVAAEAKAFLPLGWKAEWDVRSLKEAGWNHDGRTLFKGVRKVRPGSMLVCKASAEQVEIVEGEKYWDLDFPDKKTKKDERTADEMIEGVRDRLLQSVKLRLRADVPVGIYLSGGIDSSVIAGMVTHLVKEQGIAIGSAGPEERVTCFSIAFDEGSGFDESDIANRTAEWLGVKFKKKLMDEEALASRFEDATWHCEHHNPDLNFIGKFALSEVPREEGYKVVLTGEGADEGFAGYPMFLPDYLREPDESWVGNPLDNAKREEHAGITEEFNRRYYESIGADASQRGPSVPRRMLNNITTGASMAAFQPDLFASWTDETFGICNPQATMANAMPGTVRRKILDSWHPVHSAQYIWSKGHLSNIFLSCLGDRTEMAHSIEARTPFLDHKFTEYVNQLPPSVKIHWTPDSKEEDGGRFIEKWILREAAKPFITKELYERKKFPYSAPFHWADQGPLRKLLDRLITKDTVDNLGFIDWEKCEGLVSTAFSGEKSEKGAKALRLAIVVAEWVVLGQRFSIRRAEKANY
ncbi:putative asparagine synthetase [Polychaeton citri CBS 116435]|uniref:Asparagine synthetase n=1 Tax=Polychaeton citri CBS 116435 TaxID=1314669 RepID=A0A9P4UQC8_9PEZI|nr:putative asparagine synthetase [Polychaeton citri CBS 116435]